MIERADGTRTTCGEDIVNDLNNVIHIVYLLTIKRRCDISTKNNDSTRRDLHVSKSGVRKKLQLVHRKGMFEIESIFKSIVDK